MAKHAGLYLRLRPTSLPFLLHASKGRYNHHEQSVFRFSRVESSQDSSIDLLSGTFGCPRSKTSRGRPGRLPELVQRARASIVNYQLLTLFFDKPTQRFFCPFDLTFRHDTSGFWPGQHTQPRSRCSSDLSTRRIERARRSSQARGRIARI